MCDELEIFEFLEEDEQHAKRTETRLKKRWDNLRRKKARLNWEKRKRMKTGEGSQQPQKNTEEIQEKAVLSQTDVELPSVQERDSHCPQEIAPQPMAEGSSANLINTPPPIQRRFSAEQLCQKCKSRSSSEPQPTDTDSTGSSDSTEEELHRLKVEELEFRVMAAEEQYKKACIERQIAEKILKKT